MTRGTPSDERNVLEGGQGRAKDKAGKPLWYKKGIQHWDGVDVTDDGVLGGYGHVSSLDAGELGFLEDVMGERLEEARDDGRKLVSLTAARASGGSGSFLIDHFDSATWWSRGTLHRQGGGDVGR